MKVLVFEEPAAFKLKQNGALNLNTLLSLTFRRSLSSHTLFHRLAIVPSDDGMEIYEFKDNAHLIHYTNTRLLFLRLRNFI